MGTLSTVHGSRCQWHDACHRLDCSPCDERLRFSDADPRCWGRSWPLYLLGLKLRPSQRKWPTTTTAETKKGPASCCFGKSRGLRQWSLWPCVCGRLTSHANSSVGCFPPWSFVFSACLCCLWRQWISGLNELGPKKKKKKRWKGKDPTCQLRDLP